MNEIKEINGIKFNVTIEGTGKCIVLLHGGNVTSEIWEEQIKDFSKHHRVITYDQRGYGSSDIPQKNFSYYEDLKAILDVFGVTKAIILGCSFGGSVAIDFTLKYPQYVEKLILVTTGVNGFHYPLRLILKSIRNYITIKRSGIEKASGKFMDDKYWNYFVPKEADKREVFRKIFISNERFYSRKQSFVKVLEPIAIKRLDEIKQST
jgi:pimeloyl-ACP methyl ester carboxylesterase